jgi:hypothetical protein
MVILILEHFERNRDNILDRLAQYHTPAYGALIANLLPRQVELTTSTLDDVSDADIVQMIAGGRNTLGRSVSDPRGTLIQLEAIMTGESGRGDPEAFRTLCRRGHTRTPAPRAHPRAADFRLIVALDPGAINAHNAADAV